MRSSCFFASDVEQAANEVCIIADEYSQETAARLLREVARELERIARASERECAGKDKNPS